MKSWPFYAKKAPVETKIENVAPVKLPPGKIGFQAGHVLGIDVSHHEPRLSSWRKAHEFGVEWMYTKATEGDSFKDDLMELHLFDASKEGIITGAYHFFRADKGAIAQARLFLQKIAPMEKQISLPPIFDWEEQSAMNQLRSVQIDKALDWLHAVKTSTGRTPIIYGGEAFLRELNLPEEFAQFPVILAHYGCTPDKVKTPPPWSNYWAWQFTDRDDVPGMAAGHRVDANWFNGTLAELREFVAK